MELEHGTLSESRFLQLSAEKTWTNSESCRIDILFRSVNSKVLSVYSLIRWTINKKPLIGHKFYRARFEETTGCNKGR